MIVKYAESNVLGSGGLGQTQSFQIRTNAHAFKMLSSGLYSDKIGAVLREIGCNAHDAHISGGIAHTPIEVKLPNGIDDQFWIRDRGPGLSFDEVMGLYTTYFASTKQESDDFTGGFGLGSKSPFSYTDSFMIVSHHGGKQMTFTAHIGNDGSPKIALMSEAPTTETGIKISFSVPAKDFAAFQTKAQIIYQYFTPLPTILGGDDIRPRPMIHDFGRYAITGEGYNYGHNPVLQVQMGNVVYPVNHSQLTKVPNEFVAAFHQSSGFLFRVKIGALSVAASREELQYDEPTIKALTEEMKAIATEVCLELETEYTKISDWKSKCAFRSTFATLDRGLVLGTELLKAAGVKDPKGLYTACRTNAVTVPDLPWPANITVVLCREMAQSGTRFCMERHPALEGHDFYVALLEDLTLVSGTETLASNRIRKALHDGTYKKIIAVYPTVGKTATQAEIDAVVAHVVKHLGKIDQIALSTLDKPIITRTKKPKLPAGQFPDGDVYDDTGLSSMVKASSVADKVYVTAERKRSFKFHITGTKTGIVYQYWHFDQFEDHVNTIRKFTTLAQPVFITPLQIKQMKITDNPAWEEYGTYLRRTLTDPALIKKLRAEVKDYVPKIDLSYHGSTPLECLVLVKHKCPSIWNSIKPVAKKTGILGDIERVHDASTDPQITKKNTPELITHYRHVLTTISDPLTLTNLPDLDRAESAVNKKLSNKFQKLNSQFILNVAQISEAACITILNEALT